MGGGGVNIAFHRLPICGTSSELEAVEARDSPAFGSKDEVVILSRDCERGSSSSKRRGEVDGAMKQRILSYRKAPMTQAKRSSLFHYPRVLLSNAVACFDTAPICSHLWQVELKDRVRRTRPNPPNPHTCRYLVGPCQPSLNPRIPPLPWRGWSTSLRCHRTCMF